MAAGAAIVLLAGASSAAAQAAPRATVVDPQIVSGSAQRQLDAARGRWRAADVRDYHFTVERQCFCVPAFRGPVTIVVRDDVPLAAPAPFTGVATVPRLHAVVQEAIDDRVDRLAVEYDKLGVPTSIFVDRSTSVADEEIGYRLSSFAVDAPQEHAKGDARLYLRWEGPLGDATHTLKCRDGVPTGSWPDRAVCTRLLTTSVLTEPITAETKDLRYTEDPQLFAVIGHIEGRRLKFKWVGRGSSTRLARLRRWETALGRDAIAAVREAEGGSR
jgi:hypothetical protein